MSAMSAIRSVFARPFCIMGIVNVTPDSFYDGGRYNEIETAIDHAKRLAREGADILDVGGASSRPGAKVIEPEEEGARIIPVIHALSREFDGPISVDTTSASVARSALEAGAMIINDISAGRLDSGMAALVAASGCTVVLMHSRGTPQTMQRETLYDDVVSEVKNELLRDVEKFLAVGVHKEQIIIDPGIGFAKTAEQNVALLAGLKSFADTGFPVLIGTSRKSFIGHITGREVPDRLAGTLGSIAPAFLNGAKIFRVHDVAATKDFLTMLFEIDRFGKKETVLNGRGA